MGAGAFAGSVYFAVQNDEFHDTFVQYVPFADQLIFRAESLLKQYPPELGDVSDLINKYGKKSPTPTQQTPETAKSDDSANKGEGSPRPSSEQQTAHQTIQPGSGVLIADLDSAPRAMEVVDKAKQGIFEQKASHVTAATPAAGDGVEFVSTPMLDVLDVNSTDPVVQGVINDLNQFILQINSAKYSKESVQALQAAILNLNKQVGELRSEHDLQLSTNRKELYERFQEMHEKTVDDKLAEQRESLLAEFAQSREQLENAHNERLKREINAHLNAVMQRANNLIVAGSIEAQRQFREQVADIVEQEREGRLAKIEELVDSVDKLSEFAERSGKLISYSDNLSKFHIAVAKLWSALNSQDEAVPLGPYINEVRKYAVKDDPVVEAALANIPADALEDGVLTHAQLAARFRLLVPQLRKASLLPPNAGIAGHVGSWLFSMLMMPKTGNPKGDDVESIFARAETALSEGRVVDALAEVNSLKGWPKKLAGDWLNEGRKRGEVEFLIGLLSENATLSGLDS